MPLCDDGALIAMTLTPGTRLGPYEIVSRLGAGGMGEVFESRDTRLDRKVAIKVLPPEFSHDAGLRSRFEREARTISQLEHPHICRLYDIGEDRGTPYLVMELLPGESLAERLGRGPLPLHELLRHAAEIADALDRAHRAGVVHRDLKPGNVMLTRSGAKLLDFGLARSRPPAIDADAPTEQLQPLTREGTVVGTLPYMSPEQLHGDEVDARSDIFAFGAVLYEMMTGRRPFLSSSSVGLAAQILEHQPPRPSELQPGTPAALEHIVLTCLQKDPDARFQCAADVAHELRWIASAPQPVAATLPAAPVRSRAWPRAAAAIVLVLLTAAATAFVLTRRAAQQASPVTAFRQLTFDGGEETHPAISPDGKMFAYVKSVDGQRDVFVQRVDGRTAINLTRDSPFDDSEPAFSPDGNLIAFRSERDGGGIFVMGATGESVRRLTERGFNPAWSPDGSRLVFASEQVVTPRIRDGVSGLAVVDLPSGAVRELYKGDAVQPVWSPSGKRIAFWAVDLDRGWQRDVYTIDSGGDPGSVVAITDDAFFDWSPAWSPDGRALYFSSDRDGTMNLWRISIDESTGLPQGKAEPVRSPAAQAAFASLAHDGRQLIYGASTQSGELLRLSFDPVRETFTTDPKPLFSGSMILATTSPSPDGAAVAFTTTTEQEDVYVMNGDGSGVRQLTNDAFRDRGISWWPDGSRVVFYSNRSGPWDAWSIRPDGSGLSVLNREKKTTADWPRVSPDGRRFAYVSYPGGSARVAAVGADTASSEPLPATERGPFLPLSWSPDGRLLAGVPFLSADGLFVYSFPDRTMRGLAAEARVCAFLDDRRILFVTTSGEVGVADVVTGEVRSRGMVPRTDGVRLAHASISEGGRTILVYGTRREGDVWQMRFAP